MEVAGFRRVIRQLCLSNSLRHLRFERTETVARPLRLKQPGVFDSEGRAFSMNEKVWGVRGDQLAFKTYDFGEASELVLLCCH